MNKTFKKIAASIMTVASLAVGAVGVSASAAEISPRYSGPTGYVSFGDGATAGIYRDSTQINISTKWNTGSTVYVELTSTSGAAASGQKNKYGYNGYASLNYTGSGFTYATSYHSAGGDSISLAR
ncbi:MAG: hypothetical protein IJN57_02445 [Oscillospiraceae bacterium]|nr:hypothetical protein [Oscillospiraceae bacterium]